VRAALMQAFLEDTCSQLTYYGLAQLHDRVREHEIAVFFRNNHFSTVVKHDGHLYLLVTDAGYRDVPGVVFERLDEIDGDTNYFGGDFRPADVRRRAASAGAAAGAAHAEPTHAASALEQADLELALRLQREEQEAAARDGPRHPTPAPAPAPALTPVAAASALAAAPGLAPPPQLLQLQQQQRFPPTRSDPGPAHGQALAPAPAAALGAAAAAVELPPDFHDLPPGEREALVAALRASASETAASPRSPTRAMQGGVTVAALPSGHTHAPVVAPAPGAAAAAGGSNANARGRNDRYATQSDALRQAAIERERRRIGGAVATAAPLGNVDAQVLSDEEIARRLQQEELRQQLRPVANRPGPGQAWNGSVRPPPQQPKQGQPSCIIG
jgi:hypothetical protein